MSRFVIVGAGECGARAAFSLREKGFAGEVVLIGEEPLAPYERPPLSKQDPRDSREPKFVAARERYLDERIDLLTGVAVTRIDPARKAVQFPDGRSLAYDKLLLATGATARPFPGTAKTMERIRSLRNHEDALVLHQALQPRRHIVIIGGGFIGLEFAACARKMQADVTLIEGLPRILTRGVPQPIAETVAARHMAEGVDIRCGTSIAAIEEEQEGVRIVLLSGEVIAADLVLAGIGAVPNTLLAETGGLALDNGIAVNDRLETSASDIYAAGDCCSFPIALYGGRRIRLEAWRNAQEQGALAAANMLGANETISAVPWFWSDQYDLSLQIVGLAEGAATTWRRDIGDNAFLLFHVDEHGRLLAASGIGPGNAVARDIRLAEMLIAARAHPSPEALTSANVKLKSLLAA